MLRVVLETEMSKVGLLRMCARFVPDMKQTPRPPLGIARDIELPIFDCEGVNWTLESVVFGIEKAFTVILRPAWKGRYVYTGQISQSIGRFLGANIASRQVFRVPQQTCVREPFKGCRSCSSTIVGELVWQTMNNDIVRS